jgi:hypothetical protein
LSFKLEIQHWMSNSGEETVTYDVYIRVDRPRDGVEDPVQVRWDDNKQQLFWDVLSQSKSGKNVAWQQV